MSASAASKPALPPPSTTTWRIIPGIKKHAAAPGKPRYTTAETFRRTRGSRFIVRESPRTPTWKLILTPMNTPRILSTGFAALLALPAFAVDRNWTGGGAPSDWNDPLNWDTGVPTSGTADRIFLHLPGSLTGPALTADVIQIGVGSPGVPTSGFTFGTGIYTVNFIGVGEAHDGLNPTTNRYGRAFINSGTTVNVGNFWIGDWDGGTGHVVQSGGDVNISNQFRVGHWPQRVLPTNSLLARTR